MTIEKKSLDYRNKIILAPMVRVGTLPLRLLALEYGADMVYSEELIDLKIIRTKRRVNSVLGTIDFVDPADGSVIFRTCDLEKDKVVLQLGTADPQRALTVGKLVENDIAAIDINMGCPKEFSIKGGMGAALMAKPEKAKEILRALVQNLRIPVTCKTRIYPKIEDTINFVKELSSVGISAIAIHARTKDERPRHNPHPDYVKKVAESVDIPVIANGGSKEIEKYSDIDKFRKECGTDSVMIARAAQWNASIFRRDGIVPLDDVIKRYLKLCVDYDNTPSNTKYCIQNMLKEQQETPRGKQFLACQTLEQICEIWGLGEYCHKKQLEYQANGNFCRRDVIPGNIIAVRENDSNESGLEEPSMKKFKKDDENGFIESNIAFFRANYKDTADLPKSILHLYASKSGKDLPKYETQQEDRLFRTTLSFNGKRYRSSYWEKNKKFAEQGAALVCVFHLGLVSEESLIKNGSILR